MSKKESPLPKIIQRMKLVIMKPDFIERVENIRVKHGLPKAGYADYREMRANERTWDVRTQIRNSQYLEALAKLQKRYKLGPYYTQMVDFYYHYNKLEQHVIPTETVKWTIAFDDTLGIKLSLSISPESTSKDIVSAWKNVEIFQKKMLGFIPGRFNTLETLDRDLMIVTLRRQKVPSKDVAKRVNQEFNLSGKQRLSYTNVDSINSKLKKRISDS